MSPDEIMEARRNLCLIMAELGKISDTLTNAEPPVADDDPTDREYLSDILSDACDAAIQIQETGSILMIQLQKASLRLKGDE